MRTRSICRQEHGITAAPATRCGRWRCWFPPMIALGVYLVIHGPHARWWLSGRDRARRGAAGDLPGRALPALKRVAAPDWSRRWRRSAPPATPCSGSAACLRLGLLQELPAAGNAGELLSAGSCRSNSVAVGLEVAGAFLVVWTVFLDQALLVAAGARTHELPALRGGGVAVRGRPVGGGRQPQSGPHGPVPDHRSVGRPTCCCWRGLPSGRRRRRSSPTSRRSAGWSIRRSKCWCSPTS